MQSIYTADGAVSYTHLDVYKRQGKSIADNTTILYGGSANGGNAKELFSKPDVDGGLIGGASLSAEKFLPVIEGF